MTMRGLTGRRRRRIAATPRVGLFGLLGSGNIGNDASMDAVLRYLRMDHPDAIVDAMCMGPERITAQYGIDATRHLWYQKYDGRVSRVPALALKALGKGVDVFRTASWVRKHDAIIVPGMGVLEATLPLWPWGFPYAMFLLCASGRLFGTKVALVSVGAGTINQRTTRWLFNSAARLAFYRSYRDAGSREAMRQRGLDTRCDPVYPDLAFALPVPPGDPGSPQVVGVGVMAYYGSNDDRKKADEIYASYLESIKCFVRWLVDDGRSVRLFVGDSNGPDDGVAQQILADLRLQRPGLEPGRVVAQPVASFTELMQEMAPAGIVVGTRFHNVICALKLGKPTISLGYARKCVELMADMGLSDFCQSASSMDVDLLVKQFKELESRALQLRETIAERNLAKARQLGEQFDALSGLLFPASGQAQDA